MEENLDENIEGNKEPSYYDTKGKKVSDTFIGFFGGLFAYLVIGGIFSTIRYSGISIAVILLSVVAYIVAVIGFITRGRKFIAIGLILLVVIPLIVFGGCLLVMGR